MTGRFCARPRTAGLAFALWLATAPGGLLALEVPALAGRVNDHAGLLDEPTRQRIEQKLADFERESGSQVAVLTVPSLEGDNLEDFSIRVVETWELGRAGVDDGVLLLIARDERRLRLEVGYGLEGVIPDALARRIVDNVIVPRLQEGEAGAGIESGLDAVIRLARGETAPPEVTGEHPVGALLGWLAVLWAAASGCLPPLGIVVLFVVVSILQRRYPTLFAQGSSSGGSSWTSHSGGTGSSWSSSGSSSGGSGGFSGGGGGFGGGGASGRW